MILDCNSSKAAAEVLPKSGRKAKIGHFLLEFARFLRSSQNNYFAHATALVGALKMISALRHGQVSRTFEEDDELEVVLGADVKLESRVFPGATVPTHTTTAIFSISPTAKAIAQSLITTCEMTLIANVVAQSGKQVFATVHHSSTSNVVVICHTQDTVPDSLAFSFCELFDIFGIETTVVMDSVSISTYVGRGEEGALRKMSTSSSGEHVIASVPNLAIGNLVTGVSAALMNRAEARGQSAVLYAVLSRVYLSAQSMRAFEALLPVFRAALGDSVQAPGPEDYGKMLKRDPYVMKTENLYS